MNPLRTLMDRGLNQREASQQLPVTDVAAFATCP